MHVLTILRYYLGFTQMDLAEKSGVSYADINEIENKPAYGQIGKYDKLAKYLKVPVHALVMNDVLSIPETFFNTAKRAPYTPPTKSKTGLLGRQGEDAVFLQEQKRLQQVNKRLENLVIPCYKLREHRGYDILSYKDDGTPIFIEVKTREKEGVSNIQLTKYEYDTAKKLTSQGYDYWLYILSGCNTENQTLEKIKIRELIDRNRISPVRYICDFKERKETENGILHFRKQMGISQIEAANMMEIPASCLCKYETGESQCPVTAYQKLSKLYNVTIDDLMREFPAS